MLAPRELGGCLCAQGGALGVRCSTARINHSGHIRTPVSLSLGGIPAAEVALGYLALPCPPVLRSQVEPLWGWLETR